ncbi:hypothetical protein CYG68_20920 [Morganella morganii]|uniref:Uncharacterized protein n=1 Tax=Morganella morganii TaxID=582 RepID=A0A8I0Q0J7_MORMO|nr:hypothetical protein [Morganella morganii]MBE8614792.1 hypothetical protein [Morganella morganii]
MAGIQVIAGSFPKGWASMGFGTIVFAKKPKQGFPENIVLNPKEELLSIELADSEEESRIGKAAGTGLLGGLIFGGAGLVIGGLLGAADKTKKTITFKAMFTGNRLLLAKTDSKTFVKLQSIAADNAHNASVINMKQTNRGDVSSRKKLTENPQQQPDLPAPATTVKMTAKDKLESVLGLGIIAIAVWAIIHFFF